MNEALTRLDMLRLEALIHSVNSRNLESTTDDLVDRARKFEEFLLRDDNKEKQPAYPQTDDVSDKKYVCIKVDAMRAVVCMRINEPTIPPGFLNQKEYGFIIEVLDWGSWYDNN